jgi:hypothetical protein
MKLTMYISHRFSMPSNVGNMRRRQVAYTSGVEGGGTIHMGYVKNNM